MNVIEIKRNQEKLVLRVSAFFENKKRVSQNLYFFF